MAALRREREAREEKINSMERESGKQSAIDDEFRQKLEDGREDRFKISKQIAELDFQIATNRSEIEKSNEAIAKVTAAEQETRKRLAAEEDANVIVLCEKTLPSDVFRFEAESAFIRLLSLVFPGATCSFST